MSLRAQRPGDGQRGACRDEAHAGEGRQLGPRVVKEVPEEWLLGWDLTCEVGEGDDPRERHWELGKAAEAEAGRSVVFKGL